MRLNADFQKYNAFRAPDWRFQRVLELVHPTLRQPTKRDDAWIKKARAFVWRWRTQSQAYRERLFCDEPGLYYAYEIHERSTVDPEPALFVQARLLARQSPEAIAEALSTIPDTIRWYEALFFNVSDRLQNRDWITKHVLLPALERSARAGLAPEYTQEEDEAGLPVVRLTVPPIGSAFLDGTLKMFAYFGGAHMVDYMISGFRAGMPLTSPDDLNHWLTDTFSLTTKRRATQAMMQFEVNRYNVMDLFRTHAAIMEIERDAESGGALERGAFASHAQRFLDELPWQVGADGLAMPARQRLAVYANSASELRAEEMAEISAGRPVELDILKVFPPPRPKMPVSLDGQNQILR